MIQKIETVLTALGVSAGDIAKLKSDDEETQNSITAEAVISTVKEASRNALLNDGEFVNGIKLEERRTLLAGKENKLHKLVGFTAEEIAALPEKDYDAHLQAAITKLRSEGGKGKTDLTDEIDRLNTEIGTLKDSIKEYEEVKIPAIRSEVQAEKDSNKLLGLSRAALSGENAVEFAIDADMGHSAVMNQMNQKWDLKLSEEKNSIVLYNKGQETKAYNDNVELNFVEEYRKIATDGKMVKLSKGGPDNTRQTPDQRGGGGTGTQTQNVKNMPGLEEAQANVDQIGAGS